MHHPHSPVRIRIHKKISVRWTTPAGPADCRQAALVVRASRLIRIEQFEQLLPQGRARGRQRVIGPIAVLACRDQAQLSQVREMARGRGLRNSQDGRQVADTEFAGAQEVQHPEPGGISQGTENVRRPLNHIRGSESGL